MLIISTIYYNSGRCLAMGKVIAKGVVKRRKGYLYYVDAKGNSICV